MNPGKVDENKAEAEVEAHEQERRKKLEVSKGVANAEIVEEMEKAFIDYAMSVIVDRALPAVEDGLKPVHRRILWAMHILGLESNKQTMKSARIVGETMGKFHPHGNIALYDTLVRMAQDFSLRYPLVHGQGNMGSIDGDSAAADRYCIVGDSLVVTENGLEEINTISRDENINLRVLSRDKKIHNASKWFDSGEHETIKITTHKGYSLTGSKNHPILILNKDQTGKPIFAWKVFENIKEGDIAVIDRREDTFWPDKEVELTRYWPQKRDNHQHIKSLPKALSGDLAYILGALISEGSISKNKLEFCNTDEKFIEEFEIKWKRIFPDSILHKFKKVPSSYGKKEYYRLECHSRYTLEFLRNIGLLPVKSAEKSIPMLLLKSPKNIISQFLRSYYEGDGSIFSAGRKIELNCCSVSQKLMAEIQIILLRFGIESKIRLDKAKGLYKLIVDGKTNIFRFYKNIGFLSERKSKVLELIVLNYKKDYSATDYVPFISDFVRSLSHSNFIMKHNFDRYSAMNDNYKEVSQILLNKTKKDYSPLFEYLLTYNYLFDRIAKVESAGINTVYSIKVESDCHSFISNGFVSHNTEAKMSKIADELLADIEKATVKMLPNYDNSQQEPETLPAKLPNLLLNGATGIAVGMATNMPPHNLTNVCDTITAYINKPAIKDEELVDIIEGPDFPTGGIITGNGIRDMYLTGKGKIVIRAKISIEEHKERSWIIVTEIPYMVNKAELVKTIAQLVTDKKIQDISDLRDESAKGKIRIVIELKKGVDPKYTLNKLYKMTNLQTSFDANMLALLNKQPRVLTLKQIIEAYVNYRRQIVKNRGRFELKKAEDRIEIVQGLLLALKQIDAIVAYIKKSANATEAHEGLMKKFGLTTRQSKAVLETRLQQLTHLEDTKLKDEEKELKGAIEDLKKLLGSEQEILSLIKKEVSDLKRQYGDERRTKIIRKIDEITEQDMIEKKDVVVMLTEAGYIKRVDLKAYKEQKRGGAGITGADLKEEDFVRKMLTCNTHDYLLFFTNRGRVYWLKANDVPSSERQGKGKAIVNVLNLHEETITNVMSVRNFENGYLFFVTKLGIVKKLPLKDVAKPRNTGVRIMNLPADGSDTVINVRIVSDKQEVMIVTKKGQAVRFTADEESVRAMGRASYGVKGVELGKGDEVVALETLPADGKGTILVIGNKGYGKRSEIEEFRKTSRGAKGVIAMETSDKTGDIISALYVEGGKDSVIITTTKGMVIRIGMKDIRVMGRATQGVRVVNLKEGDRVADVVKVPNEEVIASCAENKVVETGN